MKNLDYRKYCLIIVSLVLVFTLPSIGQTNITGGDVSGTWLTAGSPYYIQGEITIPNSETLTIEPGINIIFLGHYKFNVQGRLLAIGTLQDSIYFTAENTNEGWHGIRFNNTPVTNDTSKIIYCSFKYGNANTGSGLDRCAGAILISRFDNVLLSNCLFDSNKQSGSGWSPPEASPAIYIYYASPIIRNSTFTNNVGSKGSAVGCITCPNAIISNNIFLNNSGAFGAIAIVSNSNGIISDNIISNNTATWGGGGILIDNYLTGGSSSPRLENNIITYNQSPIGGGIWCYFNANPVLINNTIAYNSANSGGGIYCESNSNPIFINNILYGNSASAGNQVYLVENASEPIFEYCDIQGGKEEFGGNGSGVNYTGRYENDIDSDPLFLNATSDDFQLTDYSPCIGAGTDSIEIAAVWYRVPLFGIGGNPRPSPAESVPDIGACENLLGSHLVGVSRELNSPKEFTLHQNYPNPFNPSTKIKYSVPQTSQVHIKVFDVLGNEIETLVNEEKPTGSYELKWNASKLSSGIYFYQLKAGEFLQTRKMILMK
jgi:parallel beta-helix repeat protein